MLKQLDLDEVAQAFLSVRTPDRSEYERLLMRAREKAVRPLLTALLMEATKQRRSIEQISPELKSPSPDNSFDRYLYAKTTFEPTVEQVAGVIARIGQPAKIELCRTLLERDDRIVLAAALLLAMDQSPSTMIGDEIQNALAQTKQGTARDMVFMVLGVILMRCGDLGWQQGIEEHARSVNITVQTWIERTTDTALIELLMHR